MAEANGTDKPELAPNQWFTEYGMPYTTALLEGEAEQRREHPELAGQDRHPLSQFIIDQETAVARDFHEGRISQEEFDAFKALSQERVDTLREGLVEDIGELGEDVQAWEDRFSVSLQDFKAEHHDEMDRLVETARVRELDGADMSLKLAADVLGVTVDAADNLFERLPPHVHDLLDTLEDRTTEAAQDLLDARGELSSSAAHDLERDQGRLDELMPVVEAEFDTAHEGVDAGFDRIDAEFDKAHDVVEAARDHAALDPDLTVEQMPWRTIEDPALREEMENDTGVVES